MIFESLLEPIRRRLRQLPDERKQKVRAYLQVFLRVLPHKHDLKMLSLKYGGDKQTHGYLHHYTRLFSPLRRNKLVVLEIGVGGFSDSNSGGESLRMWRDYFPNGLIYGIDIVDKSALNGRRIKTYQGDQSDEKFLKSLIDEIGRPDIIIDDGSHQNPHVLASFEILFPLLADNGIYVIEDLYTSYWSRMGGSCDPDARLKTSMGMLQRLTDCLNYQYIPHREPNYLDHHVTAVQFFRKIAFIQKGDNSMDEPAHVMEDLRREEELHVPRRN